MAKKTELNLGISEENKLFLQMVAYLINRKISDTDPTGRIERSGDYLSECFVRLTPELAEHIIEITKNSSDDDWKNVRCPYNGWGEAEDADFRKHIGQVIFLSQYGESWDTVMEDRVFPGGIEIDYADTMLAFALADMDERFFGESQYGCSDLYYLRRALMLLKANGMSEQEIFKLVKETIEEEMSFIDE